MKLILFCLGQNVYLDVPWFACNVLYVKNDLPQMSHRVGMMSCQSRRTLKRLGNKKFVQSGEVRTSRHSRKEK